MKIDLFLIGIGLNEDRWWNAFQMCIQLENVIDYRHAQRALVLVRCLPPNDPKLAIGDT
jgi:hypothetical protein